MESISVSVFYGQNDVISFDNVEDAISFSFTRTVRRYEVDGNVSEEDINRLLRFDRSIDIIFTNINLKESIVFQGKITNTIHFKDCSFNEIIIGKQTHFRILLKFDSCTIERLTGKENDTFLHLSLINNSSIRTLHLEDYNLKIEVNDCLMTNDWIFERCIFSSPSIKNIKGSHNIKIMSGEVSYLEVDDMQISRLSFEGVVIKNDIKLVKLGKYLKLMFENCSFTDYKLEIEETNGAFITITQCRMEYKGELKFNSKHMSYPNILINQCNFSHCIDIFNVHHSSISLTNTVFNELVVFRNKNPKNLKIMNSSFQKGLMIPIDDNSHSQIHSSVWCVLKNKALQSNDKIKALDYRKLEMDAYTRELFSKPKKCPEKTILILNKISNNHGLSWTRGIAFTLVTVVLFYYLYYVSKCNFDVSCKYVDFNNIKVFIANALQFLWIPQGIKDLEIELPLSKSWYSFLIMILSFFLGKILIAYGIYQTVAAFRKHGKI